MLDSFLQDPLIERWVSVFLTVRDWDSLAGANFALTRAGIGRTTYSFFQRCHL